MKTFARLGIGVFLVLTLVITGCTGTEDLQGNLRNAKVADFGVKSLSVDSTFHAGQQDRELMKFEVTTRNQPAISGASFTVTTTGSGMIHAFLYPGFVNFYNMEITDSAGNVLSEARYSGGGIDVPEETSDDFVNTVTFDQFNYLPAAGTTETFILRADIGSSATLYDDPTTVSVTLDTLFGTAVNLAGSTITATP
ncbi:MAG: hypothetical protein AAB802_00500 [Patescibacteria group bacterium]